MPAKVGMDGCLEDVSLICTCGHETEFYHLRIGAHVVLESQVILCRGCGKNWRVWLNVEELGSKEVK